MIKITTVVFAHGDAIDVVYRHLPVWKSCTDELVIISPNDNSCIVKGITCMTYEGRQHHGQLSLKRQLFAMKASLLFESDYYVFLEYDSFLLRRPDISKNIQGNLWNERFFIEKNEKKLKSGQCFLHFPWIFPKKQLEKFLKQVKIEEDDEAPQDIWMLQKLAAHNFKIDNLMGFTSDIWKGYSVNSINDQQKIDFALSCVKNHGAYAIHGVKTKEVFDLIVKASNRIFN